MMLKEDNVAVVVHIGNKGEIIRVESGDGEEIKPSLADEEILYTEKTRTTITDSIAVAHNEGNPTCYITINSNTCAGVFLIPVPC
ncbi:MAG: hypothetical protein IMF01_02880 [Proteobacteria bacterium]|nr:hypothetical protein [Pseudomonadota bacterium]